MKNLYSRNTFSLIIGLLLSLPAFLHAQCISTFPYTENFDVNNGGWLPSGGGPIGWNLGTPNKTTINSAFSPPRSYMTGLTNSEYTNNNNSFVTSPCFDFTSMQRPAISFMAWWECEYNWDGATFLYSTDGGVNWNSIGDVFDPVNWYNYGSIFSQPGGQTLGWTGTAADGAGSQGWVNCQHELVGLAGESNVRFRFAFSSDFSQVNYDGFAFDDILIADLPIFDLGNDTILCFADTLQLSACVPEGVAYSWNTNNPFDTLCTLTVVNTASYEVTVTDSNNFKVKDTIFVLKSPTFVNLGPDVVICPGDTHTLNAMNPWADHFWEPMNDTSQIVHITQTGSYKVTVSDSLNCVEIDSINIVVDFVPVVDLGPDSTICIGESIILDAGAGNPGTTYQWNFSGQATTQTVFVSAPAEYIVVVTTAANCQATDTMNLDVVLSPVVDLGPDRVECGTFLLDALNPGSSYLWNTNDTTQTISSTIPGTYYVTVTNVFGCFNSDTVNIDAGLVPFVDLGDDQVICNGATVTLDAGNPGQTYLWSTGATSQTLTVSTAGLYFVNVTTGDNCEASDSVDVILSPLTVDLGPDITICDGKPYVLNAGNTGNDYLWNTNETTTTITITTGGTYSVEVSDTIGCSAADEIFVTAQPDFVADLTFPDTVELYESAQFLDLSGGNPNDWVWEFGDGNTSTLQNPSYAYQSLGTFTVCITASDGVCTNSACKDIFVDIFEVDGIEEELGLEFSLFPNPNSGHFELKIELPKAHDLAYQILNLNGQQLMYESIGIRSFYTTEIHRPDLAKGVYLLKLEVDGMAIYRKLMID